MTQIIPIRRNVALRELMCGKHEKPPTPYAMRLELAVLNVAERVARGSTLTAAQHMSIWLDHDSFVPLASIRAEFERIV